MMMFKKMTAMKTRITLITLAIAALAVSCMKESNPEVTPAANKVTVRVTIPEDTKVSMTEASNHKSMGLAWEASDAISINGETFSIKAGFSAHEAEFEGNAPSGTSYTIIYPGKYADMAAFNARSYASQTQDGNSSTAHLEYNAALEGVSAYLEPKFDPSWAADNDGSLVQNAVVQMRLQLPDGASNPTSVSLIATNDIFPTTNAGTPLTNEMTLSLKNVTLPTNRILEAYMMVSAAGVTIADGEVLTVAVVTPDATYVRELTLSAQTWTGGGQYTLQLKDFNVHNFDINTVADLETFRDGVNSGSILWQTVHANLTTDLDCSSISSWTPIGNGTFEPVESGTVSATWAGPVFQGVFDGQGHAIKNLKMTGSPDTYRPFGLFGILYKATVKNLTLGASSGDTGVLTATPQGRMDAGAVAGVAYGATVQNVTNYFPMTIPTNSSPNRVAMAMVGYVYGDAASGPSVLSGLANYGTVTATQSSANTGNGITAVQVAGIAGFGNSGHISVINEIVSCTNYAEINAITGRSAGVLATANTRTNINACVNEGNVTNTSSGSARVGGISVILGGGSSMTDCVNKAAIQATVSLSNVGGLVCLVNQDNCSITNSTNTGSVSGTNYVAGIAARIYGGTITQCVNTGNITGDAYVGGIVGCQGNNNGWPYINKCRSNATITANATGSSSAGGIAGQMLGGVLNTCFAKGAVVAAGYDVGGIVGQMYCNQASGQSYGRQYVYDCLAAVDVTSTRTAAGAANLGGVVGRILRKNDSNNNGQYMAVDNCIGLNQKLSGGSHTYVGAFVGQVNANNATNYKYVRVRNCISLVENSNLDATSATYLGGFTGYLYGSMYDDFYLVDVNHQTIHDSYGDTSNLTKSDATTLTSPAFCEDHSTRATTYGLTVNSVTYKSSGWTIPTGCSYPVPVTLANLGSDYYE